MALCCVGVDSCIYSCYNTILFCYYTCTAMLRHSRALSGYQTKSGNDLSRVINREDDQVIAKEDGKSK